MGFGLQLSSVNFGASGFSNDAEQLVSPDHHFLHILKELQSSSKSMWSHSVLTLFMVISLHVLVNVTDPFQLKPPSRDYLCLVYRKPIPSSTTSCGVVTYGPPHLCMSIRHSLQRVCPCQSHPYSPLTTLSLRRPDPQVLFELPAMVPSSWLMVALVGLEGGLAGSCPHCSKLGLASSTNLGMFSSPQADLHVPS